jgi:diguanylate cyclase (GGDEF)-like protein
MRGEAERSSPVVNSEGLLSAAVPDDTGGATETAVLDLLDSAAGNDPRALRAVLRVSQAVLGAHRLDEALEVIACESLAALDAASFSISRWERDRGLLRTLINVGELGPDEERWPHDEHYPLAEFEKVAELLRNGEAYVNSVDAPDTDEAGARVLRELGKESELAVPVMYESAMWGELWATGARGRRFGPDDIRLLKAVAAQVSVAIGRAELFSEVSQFAYEDPLTRLANRRGLDERLRELAGDDVVSTLLVCDVDRLKEVNDRDGHPAGDALLRGIADALSAVASAYPGSLVARLGGDEFCVVLPGRPLSDAEDFARATSRQVLRELGPESTVCWGAAAPESGSLGARELIAAADSALLEAKRLGPGRMRLRSPSDGEMPEGPERRRDGGSGRRRAIDDLIPRAVEALDERQPATTLEALALLAYEFSRAVDAAAWSISATTDDETGIRTVRGVESQFDAGSGLRVVELAEDAVYPLADYPITGEAIRNRTAFVVDIDRPGCDSSEVRVLRELGYRALLAAGTSDHERGYLLEVYFDGDHPDLIAFAPHLRVLTHYCARGDREALA